MDKLNQFFRKLYSNPALLWAFFASLLFIALSLVIFFVPSYGFADPKYRITLGGGILLYGLFRLYTFYMAFKSLDK